MIDGMTIWGTIAGIGIGVIALGVTVWLAVRLLMKQESSIPKYIWLFMLGLTCRALYDVIAKLIKTI